MKDAEEKTVDQDLHIAEALIRGDSGAHSVFIDRFFLPLTASVTQFNIPYQDAEEIALAGLRSIADKIDSFDPALGKFASWVFAVISNLAKDHKRRLKREEKLRSGSLESLDAVDSETIPETSPKPFYSTNLALKCLFLAAFNSLKEEDRSVLSLSSMKYSYATIGEILGKSEVAVKVQVHRARRKLQQRVESLAEDGSVDISGAHWGAMGE